MDTVKIAQNPVFFEKNRVFRVYLGGKLFSDFFGDDSTDGFYPEEWVCSSTKALNEGSTDPYEGISLVEGTNIHLNDLLQAEKDLMLGNRNGLDVLVKALDAAIRLPVQAHPDKAFSQKHFNSDFGKAESWLILATREDACIYFGFKDGVTAETFEKAVNDSETDKTAMENLLNKIPVQAGDVYFIPARAVHAIGSGCLILEVQEPTDFTIQPERWCGDYKLSDTQMYLDIKKDIALSVFDYSYNLKKVMSECKKTPSVIYETKGCKKESLIGKADTPCFSIERYILENGKTELLPSVRVYIVTQGNGTLYSDGYSRQIKKGDYFFMPYSCDKKFRIKTDGTLTLVACIPPDKSASDDTEGNKTSHSETLKSLILRDNFTYSPELEDEWKLALGEYNLGLMNDRVYEYIGSLLVARHENDTETEEKFKKRLKALVKHNDMFYLDLLFKKDTVKDSLSVPQSVRDFIENL